MIENSDLPKGWTIAKFEDLLDYVQPTKYIIESTEYNDKYTTPVLTAGKSFIKGYTNETEGIFNSLPTIIFDDFTTATQFVNFPFKVKSSAMKILQPTCDLVNIKLAYYFMQIQNIKGDTHKRFWISEYSQLPVPLAPSNEQKRILDKIEELITDLDKGIEYLETAQQQLKVYRQAVLRWAFEGKLTHSNIKEGELPKGWKWEKLGNLFDVFIGSTPSRKRPDFWNGNINWVSSGEVAFCKITESNEKITQLGLDESSCKLHPPGTVILAMIGEGKTRGQAAILKSQATHNQNTAAIRIDSNTFLSELLYNYFVLTYHKNRGVGSGNNQKALNKERVKFFDIPLIPILEQPKVLAQIESRLSVCDKIEETIEISLLQAEALRLSIIKKAFEGKLVPQNPGDEPAEKLLQRIRAAKGKGKPEKTENAKNLNKETKAKVEL